jgi:hypothetical protein
MNKRGFLATLAAMCVAPFAVKAEPVEVPKDHIFYDFARDDGATIRQWVKWESPGRKHTTALGNYPNGNVWHWTSTGIDNEGKSGA